MILVWHRREPTFRALPDGAYFKLEDYKLVALVKPQYDHKTLDRNLADAFRFTNHIDSAWQENELVLAAVPEARSTSVGDVLQYNDKFFCIAPTGYTSVSPVKSTLFPFTMANEARN